MKTGLPKLPHPNRRPFEGALTVIGSPSDKAPGGARGHRITLTPAAARDALPSLVGMAVAFKAGYDGHDARQKCGVITSADIQNDRVLVRGFLYDHDYPEVAYEIRDLDMGMSYEMCDAHIMDMRLDVWIVSKFTFTGAAILLRQKAAYSKTWIHLVNASELDGDARLASDGYEDLLKLTSNDPLYGLLHMEAGFARRETVVRQLMTEVPDEDPKSG